MNQNTASTLTLLLMIGATAAMAARSPGQSECQSSLNCKCALDKSESTSDDGEAPSPPPSIISSAIDHDNNGCCLVGAACTATMNCTFNGTFTVDFGAAKPEWVLKPPGPFGTTNEKGSKTVNVTYSGACDTDDGYRWEFYAPGQSEPFGHFHVRCPHCSASGS